MKMWKRFRHRFLTVLIDLIGGTDIALAQGGFLLAQVMCERIVYGRR